MQQAGNFKEYISAFEKELECVIIDSISPEPYCKKYLSHLLLHKRYYLAIYADVLQKIVAHSCKNKSAITLVDYGSGNYNELFRVMIHGLLHLVGYNDSTVDERSVMRRREEYYLDFGNSHNYWSEK